MVAHNFNRKHVRRERQNEMYNKLRHTNTAQRQLTSVLGSRKLDWFVFWPYPIGWQSRRRIVRLAGTAPVRRNYTHLKRREHKKVSVVYVTQHLCLISESSSHATVIEVQVWYTAWVRVSTRAIPANTCTNGTAVTACIRASIARELTSTRAVNDFLHSPAHIQQAITCPAIARFPDRWKRAVQRNADRLVWLLISRAIDNAHMIRNKAHKRMRVITQFTISLPSIVFNFFALRTVAKKQENTHVASRYQIKRRKK